MMKFEYFLLLFSIHYIHGFPKFGVKVSKRSADISKLGMSDAAEYLNKYGYLSKSKAREIKVGGYTDARSFQRSIKKMQRTLGLMPTGKLDVETMSMIVKPRCGVEDTVGVSQLMEEGNHAKSKFRNTKSRRRQRKKERKRRKDHQNHKHLLLEEEKAKSRQKRYNLEGNRWRRNNLTYFIENFTPDMTRKQVEDSIEEAFQQWARVSTLTFTRVYDRRSADITIRFGARSHGDYYPFDGPSGTLAHAFFPENGQAHFDEEEKFDYLDGYGVNLMLVAAHEFGHALGLAHSNAPNSLMAPIYYGYVPDYQLDIDDVKAIQQLYGKNPNLLTTEAPTTKPTTEMMTKTPTNALDICEDGIGFDAAFFDLKRKELVAFEGKWFWRFDSNGNYHGYPKLIEDHWEGLKSNVDAAAYSRYTGFSYIFRGSKIYRFRDYKLDQDFPRPLSTLGLPNNVDAAMQWTGDGLMYVFKRNNFFRFNEHQQYDGIRRFAHRHIKKNWIGVPDKPDGAIQWKDGSTYFFKDDQVFRFSDTRLEVDKRYPKDLKRYFIRCPEQKFTPLRFRKNRRFKHDH